MYKVIDEFSCRTVEYDNVNDAFEHALEIEGIIQRVDNGNTYECFGGCKLSDAIRHLEGEENEV